MSNGPYLYARLEKCSGCSSYHYDILRCQPLFQSYIIHHILTRMSTLAYCTFGYVEILVTHAMISLGVNRSTDNPCDTGKYVKRSSDTLILYLSILLLIWNNSWLTVSICKSILFSLPVDIELGAFSKCETPVNSVTSYWCVTVLCSFNFVVPTPQLYELLPETGNSFLSAEYVWYIFLSLQIWIFVPESGIQRLGFLRDSSLAAQAIFLVMVTPRRQDCSSSTPSMSERCSLQSWLSGDNAKS